MRSTPAAVQHSACDRNTPASCSRPSVVSHHARCSHHLPRLPSTTELSPCHLRRQQQQQCHSSWVVRSAAVSQQVDVDEEVEVAIPKFPAPSASCFSPSLRSFSEQHRIRGSEVSPNQRAPIVTIANLLQEVAGNHAVGMWGRTDTGFANLPSMKELVFVMTRLQIRMDSYPKWGDMVDIETYFSEEGRLAARRDWIIKDVATGKQLGAATSTWVTINMASRKLSKLPDDLKKKFMKLTPPLSEPRHALPVAETKKKLPEVVLEGAVEGTPQVARRSDMDMNGHINNVTYLAWCLETVPEDVFNSYHLREMEVDFKAECHAGQSVDTLGNEVHEPGTNGTGAVKQYVHLIRRCNTPEQCYEIVRARTTWHKQ